MKHMLSNRLLNETGLRCIAGRFVDGESLTQRPHSVLSLKIKFELDYIQNKVFLIKNIWQGFSYTRIVHGSHITPSSPFPSLEENGVDWKLLRRGF